MVVPSPSQTSTNPRNDVNTNTERGIAASNATAAKAKEELGKTYAEFKDPDLRPAQ